MRAERGEMREEIRERRYAGEDSQTEERGWRIEEIGDWKEATRKPRSLAFTCSL